MKRTLLVIFFATLLQAGIAQSTVDAIQYSQYSYQGSARSQAMAGAIGAMGSDFGSVIINPAGMGLYRSRGEITLTPSFSYAQSVSNYLGQTEKDGKSNFNISNAALVISREASNYGTLRYWQFGIGVNRTYNFNFSDKAIGVNETSSLVDSYLRDIDGYSIDDIMNDYTYGPAWNTYIIDTIDGVFTSPVPQGGLKQTRWLKGKGHIDEWSFAGSLNFIDKVFLGASIGLAHIDRTNDYYFTEENIHTGEYFREWTTNDYIKTSGFGLNVNVGIIAYPVRWMRFGLAYHSPTFYNLKETWEPYCSSVLDGRTYESSQDLYTNYQYSLRTPHKFGASLAFIIGSNGIITADYEYMNYKQTQLNANDWDYSTQNTEIKEVGRHSSNFRIGTEWILNNIFVRGGFAFYGGPYRKGEETIGNTLVYSAGLGFPFTSNFGMDIAYSFIDSKSAILPYNYEGVSVIKEHHMRHNAVLTLKFKW